MTACCAHAGDDEADGEGRRAPYMQDIAREIIDGEPMRTAASSGEGQERVCILLLSTL